MNSKLIGRLISLSLSAVLAVSNFSVPAYAAEEDIVLTEEESFSVEEIVSEEITSDDEFMEETVEFMDEVTVESGELTEWTTFEVDLDANGGHFANGSATTTVLKSYNESTSRFWLTDEDREVPVRDGYVFTGWYADAACTNLLSATTTDEYNQSCVWIIMKDKIQNKLYAGWTTEYYTITFHGNGGTLHDGFGLPTNYEEVKTYKLPKGFKISYSNPGRCFETQNVDHPDGKKLNNWNTKLDGSGTAYHEWDFYGEDEFTPESDMTFYAQYSENAKKATVTLDANGGAFPDGSSTKDALNFSDTLGIRYNFDDDRYIPTRAGYVFTGWYADAACTKIVSDTEGVDGFRPSAWSILASLMPEKVYAGWTKEYYTITFDGNGGKIGGNYNWDTEDPDDLIDLESTKSYKLPKGFKIDYTTKINFYEASYIEAPEDMKFVSWNSRKDGSGTTYYEYDFYEDSIPVPTSNMTFYAQYEEGFKGVTLNANGGAFPDGATTIKAPLYTDQLNHNYYFTEDKYIPVRSGYVFTGWYADAACTEILSDTEGDEYNKPSAWKVPADQIQKTLYAGWTTEYYTITFDGNGGKIMDGYDWSTGKKGDPVNLETVKSYKLPKGFSISYTDPYEWYAGIFVQGPDGKKMADWNTERNGSGITYLEEQFYGEKKFTPTSDMTFYAQYYVNVEFVTITFNAMEGRFPEKHKNGNGGDYSEDLKTFTLKTTIGDTIGWYDSEEDEYYQLPDEPVLEEKTFEGWYSDPELKNKVTIDDFDRIGVTGDATYYAKYISSGIIANIPSRMYVGRMLYVDAKTVPASEDTIIWESSDIDIIAFRKRDDYVGYNAKVQGSSVIMFAQGEGTATITLTAGSLSYSTTITVKELITSDTTTLKFGKNDTTEQLVTVTVKNCSEDESTVFYEAHGNSGSNMGDAVKVTVKSNEYNDSTMTRVITYAISLDTSKTASITKTTPVDVLFYIYKDGWHYYAPYLLISISAVDQAELDALWDAIDDEDKTELFNDDKESILTSGIKMRTPGGSYIYTGENCIIDSEIRVYYNGRKLVQGKEYTVTYKNNLNVSTGSDPAKKPSYTVTLTGNFSGSKTVNFDITPLDITCADVTSESTAIAYTTDKSIAPSISLTNPFLSKAMKAGTDYEVFFHPFTGEGDEATPDFSKKLTAAEVKSKGAGTYLINFQGKGNFQGTFATADDYSAAPVLRVVDKEQSKKDGTLFLNDAKKLNIKDEQYNETAGTADVLSKNVIKKFADGTYKVKVGGKELVYVAPEKVADIDKEGYYFTITDPADTNESLNRYPVSGNYVTLIPAQNENNKLDGELKVFFEITGKEIDVTDMATKISYSGTPLLDDMDSLLKKLAKKGTASAKVYVKKDSSKTALSSDCYYVTASGDYGDPGTVTLKFSGNPMKGLSGTVTKKVTVTTRKITDADLTSGDIKVVFTETESNAAITVPYSKGGATAAVDVMIKDAEGEYITLNEGEDYSVKYSGNKSISTGSDKAKVSVKFKGYYSGSLKNALEFTVDKAEFDLGTIKAEAPDKIYNAKGKKNYFKSIPALYDGTEKLTKADYELVGDYKYYIGDEEITDADAKDIPQNSRITVVFTAKLKADSKNYKAANEDGTVEFAATYNLGSYKMSKCKVVIEPQEYNDGRPVEPDPSAITVTIKDNGTTVTAKTSEFEIVSVTNNQKVGTATVVLKGKGRFCGTKKATFKIVKPGK